VEAVQFRNAHCAVISEIVLLSECWRDWSFSKVLQDVDLGLS